MANKRRAAVVLGVFTAVVTVLIAAIGLLLGAGLFGLVTAVLVAGGVTGIAYWKSAAVVLFMSRARPADPIDHARLHNMVEGLCTAAGLPKPAVTVIEDDAANAFAVGRDPKHAAVVVTTGLLAKMSPVELEGVLAHELTHVKNYDILVSTLAVTIIGIPITVLGSVGARLMKMTVSPRREAFADVTGVSLTRYPPGLASALEKLREEKIVVRSASRATAHLWLESPAARSEAEHGSARMGRLFNTHPPLDERIQALREL